MNPHLNSDLFHFSLNQEGYTWNLKNVRDHGLELNSAQIKIVYRLGNKTKQTGIYWRSEQVHKQETILSPLGELQCVDVFPSPDAQGLSFQLTFAVSVARPLFLWKLVVTNDGNLPVQIVRITLLDLEEPEKVLANWTEPAFFSNGWGSWNHSGAYGYRDAFRRTRLSFFASPMRINPGTPQPKQRGVFASDMFGVLGDRANHKGLLIGFLSQEQHFGSLEVDFFSPGLSLWANGDFTQLDPGESMRTDWACVQYVDFNAPDSIGSYLEAVACQAGINDPRVSDPVLTGWCSWYHFYTDIQEKNICANLEEATRQKDQIPLNLIQIDDGYETYVGDWFDFKPGFPSGVSPLAQEIASRGFMPGLWLAPFIVDRRSQLAKQHPDWLLRGRLNIPVNAGFLWGRFATALDISNPEALEYACQVIRTAAMDWGFAYLKLDFLYAGALPGKRSNLHKTRAQILRSALGALRAVAGNQTFLLGCGCPLGSGVGLVDAMRIGADVDGRWKPALLGKDVPIFYTEPDLPSARNAIQNTLSRAFLHRRWWINDPDCLLLRDDTQLTLDEVQSLATVIALSGGLWILSDNLSELSSERLKIAQSSLPPIGQRPEVLDWFNVGMPQRVRLDLSFAEENWQLVALFNWEDQPESIDFSLVDYQLPPGGRYWLRDYWRNEMFQLTAEETKKLDIPPHGVRLFAVRAVDDLRPVYLGSDLHISQGLELKQKAWDPTAGRLDLFLERQGKEKGVIDLCLPGKPWEVRVDGKQIDWRSEAESIYRFVVEFEKRAHIQVLISEER